MAQNAIHMIISTIMVNLKKVILLFYFIICFWCIIDSLDEGNYFHIFLIFKLFHRGWIVTMKLKMSKFKKYKMHRDYK